MPELPVLVVIGLLVALSILLLRLGNGDGDDGEAATLDVQNHVDDDP